MTIAKEVVLVYHMDYAGHHFYCFGSFVEAVSALLKSRQDEFESHQFVAHKFLATTSADES